VHVVGDCATPEAASILGEAMVNYQKKRGKPAWTYSHAWRRIAHCAWKGARVLASCHKLSDVNEAFSAGYAVALTILPVLTNKAFRVTHDERGHFVKPFTVVPCPAQFKHPDGRRFSVCETCSICQDVSKLRSRRMVVGFQPDYGSGKKVLPLLK